MNDDRIPPRDEENPDERALSRRSGDSAVSIWVILALIFMLAALVYVRGPRGHSARMDILLVGSGGREHALAWKMRQSPLVDRLYCAPGNPGIARAAECVPDVRADDAEGLARLARELKVGLVVVGPEVAL
eukprot:gene56200-75040_t